MQGALGVLEILTTGVAPLPLELALTFSNNDESD